MLITPLPFKFSKIKGYAQLKIDVESVCTQVGDITNAQFTSVLQKCGVIAGSVTTFDQKINKKENLVDWDEKLSGLATTSSLEVLQNGINASVKKFEQTGVALNFQNLWEQGSTDEDEGETYAEAKSSSQYRIRTKTIYPCTTALRAWIKSGYQVDFIYFDKDRLCTGDDSGWLTPDAEGYVKPSNISGTDKYVAILIRLQNGSAVAPPVAAECGIRISEDTLINYGSVSLLIEDELSTFKVDADNIKFNTFDWTVKNPTTNKTIFHLDSSGNLTIAGKFHGEFDDTVTVGSGTKKMYIEPTSTGARLVGKDGTYETLHLGFYQHDGNYIPAMYLKSKASNSQDSLIRIRSGSDFAEVRAESAGSTGAYHIIRMIAYPRDDYATIEGNYWPKKSDTTIYDKLSNGAVYVDNGYLKVKGW